MNSKCGYDGWCGHILPFFILLFVFFFFWETPGHSSNVWGKKTKQKKTATALIQSEWLDIWLTLQEKIYGALIAAFENCGVNICHYSDTPIKWRQPYVKGCCKWETYHLTRNASENYFTHTRWRLTFWSDGRSHKADTRCLNLPFPPLLPAVLLLPDTTFVFFIFLKEEKWQGNF